MLINVTYIEKMAERVKPLGINIDHKQGHGSIKADHMVELTQEELFAALLDFPDEALTVWEWSPDDAEPHDNQKVNYRHHYLRSYPEQNGSPRRWLLVEKCEYAHGMNQEGLTSHGYPNMVADPEALPFTRYRGWWVGCDHDFGTTSSGKTYHSATCKKCGAHYTLDHGD